MKSERTEPLRDDQLALMSNAVFDVPPLTRSVLCLFGLIGVAIIGVESLTPRTETQIEIDKLIHFSGYAILAAVFVLSLRPQFLPLGLIMTAALGAVIEFFQMFTARSFDIDDMLANFVGIAAGSVFGVVARKVWSIVSRELAKTKAQDRLRRFEENEIVFSEGDPAKSFYLVKSGRVEGRKAINDEAFELGPGSVLGLLGTLHGSTHFTTIRALESTVLYEMSVDELMEDAGDRQAPVRVVLSDMADTIRSLVEEKSVGPIELETSVKGRF